MEMPKHSQSKLQEFMDNPKKGLWKMTLPFLLGLTVQSIYMLMDTMFVGKFVPDSKAALDAMGVIFPLMFIIMGLTFGLGSGVTTLIAQFIGANNKKSADSVASHAILIGIILPIVIITIVLLLGDLIISSQLRMNDSIMTIKYATEYFQVMAFGSVFMILAIFFRSILSGEGETVLPMKILGVGTILNILLDPLFIIVFKLEVMGAAIATVISNGVVALAFMYFLIFKHRSYIKISFRKNVFKFDLDIIRKLFRLGIPASLSFAIMSLGMFANNSILSLADQNIIQGQENNCANKSLAYTECSELLDCKWDKELNNCAYSEGGVIGGYQTASRLENLFMIPIIALSSSLVTMVGMFYGSRRNDLIRKVTNYGLKWAIILSVISTFVFFLFSEIILSGFTNDNKTIYEGVKYFNICAFTYPFVAIGMITCRVMQAMDRPAPFLFLTLLRVILIAVPMAWIGVRYLNKTTEWVWWSVLLSSIVAAVSGLLWMYLIMKKNQKLDPIKF